MSRTGVQPPAAAPGQAADQQLWLAYFMLTLPVLFWAGNNIAGRAAAVAEMPPIAFAFWRWVPALLCMLPFGIRGIWRHRATIVKRWRYFCTFAVLSVTAYNALMYVGLQYTTAVQGSLIVSTLPAMVVLVCHLFMNEPATPRQLAGVVISIAGAGLIILQGDIDVLLAFNLNVGDLWVCVAVLAWALFSISMRFAPMQIGLMAFQNVAIALGLVFLLPFYAWEMSTGRTMPVNATSIGLILYAGVFAGAIGFAMWSHATHWVGAKTAGYFGNLYPVFGAILGVAILGETLAWFHLVGGTLIFGGIWLATWKGRAAR